MKTLILKDIEINKASKFLNDGKIIAFKTDTIYGFSCLATNAKACKKIAEIKGRENKPLILLASKDADISKYVKNISKKAQKLIDEFWPGPLTIIFETEYPFDETVTCGKPTIGIRKPNDKLCEKLLSSCNVPIVSTSANLSGKEVLSSAEEIFECFNGSGLDLVLDSGVCKASSPSTIVLAIGEEIKILREGAIPSQKILQVINN